MPLVLPPLRELPSVARALRWLLPHIDTRPGNRIPVRARLSGLVSLDEGSNWKADGPMLTRLLKRNLRRLPDDAGELAAILHGLGEMNARSHADIMAPLINHLKLRPRRIKWKRVLDAAIKYDPPRRSPVQVQTIAFAQWITGASLGWSTFDQAGARISHPYEIHGGGHFGLQFAAKVVLAVDLHAVDSWIAEHPNDVRVATIGSAALAMMFPWDRPMRAVSLLTSRTAAIKCLAASSLVCPVMEGQALDFQACWRTLVEAGIEPGDAIWMMGMRIKNAIHARYRMEDFREKTSARVAYLRQNPPAAIGGSRNAAAEMQALEKQLGNADARYAQLLPELEGMLRDTAAVWPQDGLTDEQLGALEFIFVGTPEIRHGLAEKISHPSNREWLLKRNIAQLRDFIGLAKDLTNLLTQYYLPDQKRFGVIAPWSAQSMVLLNGGQRNRIGKQTSNLVYGIAKAAETLADQPFADARQPVVWQSAMARATCADIFALMVVACTPEERRAEVLELNRLAIEHASIILALENLELQLQPVLHQLTARVVNQMSYFEQPDLIRSQWAFSNRLPDYPRALALWSSPTLVEQHRMLAERLFLAVAQLPLTRSTRDIQISRALTLLDLAVASCAKAGKDALVSRIVELWSQAYRTWGPVSNRWADAAEMLAGAVRAEGPARAALAANSDFAQTHCRLMIEQDGLSARVA